jgi:hypothetical protein
LLFWTLAALAILLLPALAQAEPVCRLTLLVGQGTFAGPAFSKLVYDAHNDSKTLHEWLTSPQNGGLTPADVRVLLDAPATRAAILREAERISELAHPGDLVLLYFFYGFFTPERVGDIVYPDSRATGYIDANSSPIVLRSQSLSKDDRYICCLYRGSVGPTFCPWPDTSWPVSDPDSIGLFPEAVLPNEGPIPGRAACANWITPWSTPRC